MKDLAFFYQSDRFADADVVVRLRGQSEPGSIDADSYAETLGDAGSSTSSMPTTRLGKPAAAPSVSSLGGATPDPRELKRFPGHMIILCRNEYFDSQVMFQAAAAGSPTGSRPTLNFTVEDATHVPAVEAIIGALYGLKDSLAELEQHELVLVIQYADMMRLDLIVTEAVDLLVSAAKAEDGLTQETFDSLCQFAWPDCPTVVPLLRALAKSVGGNLEALWADKKLSSKLLKLPLPAIRLLLSSDQLIVHSEDTVMYTAAQYVVSQPKELQIEAGKQLSQLIRVPQLSDFQLTAQAVNKDPTAANILLCHQPSILTLKRLRPLTVNSVASVLPNAPDSWRLPPRDALQPLMDGGKLLWQVPMDKIKAAYNKCRETQGIEFLRSDSVTPPVCGTTWSLLVLCRWDGEKNGINVDVAVAPAFVPRGVVFDFVFRIEGPGVDTGFQQALVTIPMARTGLLDWCGGVPELFGCGALHGALETSAWVDRGLPVNGSIELKLTIYQIE